MSKRIFVLFALMVALMLAVTSASAITNGVPDGNGHPQVGIMVAIDYDAGAAWRCSGTMISPTVFLTAGHCTYGADFVNIFFESDVTGNPLWPFSSPIVATNPANIQAHPQYNDAAFYLHDVGIVVLDAPVTHLSAGQYGQLSTQDVLDGLATQRGRQDTSITAVGYGLQRVRVNPAGPDFTEADLRRDVAVTRMIGVNGTFGIPNGTAVVISGNANTGGTCFGDSGGPLFLNDTLTVVAVNSFAINGNCAGVAGGYRIDQADDLAFISSFLP